MKLRLFGAAFLAALILNMPVYAEESGKVANCPPPEAQVKITDALPEQSDELIALFSNEEYPVDENGYTKQLTTSNNPNEQFIFTIKDNSLEISGRITSAYKSFWVWVTDSSGSNQISQTIFSKSSDGVLLKSVNISGVADGTYTLDIYANDGTGNSYKGLIYKSIDLIKSNGEANFKIEGDIYKNNMDFINKNYRSNVYYLTQKFPMDHVLWVYTNDTVKGYAQEITKGCTDDYSKIKAIHDWAAENIYYDYAYYNNVNSTTPLTPEEVYTSKYAVCQGYSDFCASALRSIGIPCRVADGYALNSSSTLSWSDVAGKRSNHAWNEAWLEDEKRWVVFDATWDSTNKYEITNGTATWTKGSPRNTYFDISQYMFASNHRVDEYTQQTYKYLGDVNGDNSVNDKDKCDFLGYFMELNSLQNSTQADINGDGEINFSDAVALMRKFAFDKLV